MKSKICTVTLVLSLMITVANVHAAVKDDNYPKTERFAEMTEEQKVARLTEIKKRVDEIRTMDKSELSKAERKALKNELREMNREARRTQGVYLSVGAIIIIILLLILIL